MRRSLHMQVLYIYKNIVFGQLGSYTLNMVNFGISKNMTKAFIMKMSIAHGSLYMPCTRPSAAGAPCRWCPARRRRCCAAAILLHVPVLWYTVIRCTPRRASLPWARFAPPRSLSEDKTDALIKEALKLSIAKEKELAKQKEQDGAEAGKAARSNGGASSS